VPTYQPQRPFSGPPIYHRSSVPGQPNTHITRVMFNTSSNLYFLGKYTKYEKKTVGRKLVGKYIKYEKN
jgi:hypothetical protein